MKMAGESQALEIQIALKGKDKERFLKIKRLKELADEDVLQLIVNEYYDKRLADKPSTR
jgi:glycosylphosphatidylinositol transamidase (GPIT) subunit GPI8